MLLVRKVLVQVLLVFLVAVSTSWAGTGSLTVMTKNMDTGTDFGFFFAYLQTNPALGIQLTFDEVQKNDYPLRASLLAKEISESKPHVVGLEEVTLLRAGTDPTNTPIVLVDQLALLMAALAAEGEPYYVVGTNTLTDLAFPVAAGSVVRFTDRDVIIARADLPPGELSIGNVHSSLYGTILSLSGITALRGWISADVTASGHTVRFVTTHLESSGGLYGNPLVDFIQAAQAAELAATFITSPYPVVIAADFNSNATHTPPEQTASVDVMLGAGYIDAWADLRHGIPGFTWPMYVEDPLEPHPRGPFERIDFIFSRGLSPAFVERTGVKSPQSSDHAGVVAIFGF